MPAETQKKKTTLIIFQVEIVCFKETLHSFLPLDSGFGENEIKYLLDSFHTRDCENWVIFKMFELLSKKEINLSFHIKYIHF